MKLSPILNNLRALNPRKPSLIEGEVIKDAVDDNFALQVDTDSPIRWGIWVLLVGFGGFLLWAALAPLDEGVPSSGAVSIDTKRKVVQHLTGGIVKDVFVKEGQMVKEGDVMLVLDNSMAKARFQEIQQRYIGDRALQGRLLAEQSGAKSIHFHDDLLKMSKDPLAQQHMRNQEMLLSSRRAALAAELQGLAEAISGQEAQIEGLNGVLESRRSQLALLNDQLAGIRDLVTEGYAPKSQQRDLELRAAQVTGEIADSQSGLLRTKRSIAELRQRALLRKEGTDQRWTRRWPKCAWTWSQMRINLKPMVMNLSAPKCVRRLPGRLWACSFKRWAQSYSRVKKYWMWCH